MSYSEPMPTLYIPQPITAVECITSISDHHAAFWLALIHDTVKTLDTVDAVSMLLLCTLDTPGYDTRPGLLLCTLDTPQALTLAL